uniref:Uncharacterized protein n=1 Tax=Anguilla anguilla TaxID=7936 RepID=A0A0E9Q3W2_ANGAN
MSLQYSTASTHHTEMNTPTHSTFDFNTLQLQYTHQHTVISPDEVNCKTKDHVTKGWNSDRGLLSVEDYGKSLCIHNCFV